MEWDRTGLKLAHDLGADWSMQAVRNGKEGIGGALESFLAVAKAARPSQLMWILKGYSEGVLWERGDAQAFWDAAARLAWRRCDFGQLAALAQGRGPDWADRAGLSGQDASECCDYGLSEAAALLRNACRQYAWLEKARTAEELAKRDEGAFRDFLEKAAAGICACGRRRAEQESMALRDYLDRTGPSESGGATGAWHALACLEKPELRGSAGGGGEARKRRI